MCKYEEIEGWRLSNGKTIREIKTRKAHQDPQSPGELSLLIFAGNHTHGIGLGIPTLKTLARQTDGLS